MFGDDIEKLEISYFKEDISEEQIIIDEYLVSQDDLNNELESFFDGDLKKGLGLSIKEIDRFLLLKENEFYLSTGKKGRGKTTICQIIYLAWAIVHKKKFVVCFKENHDWSTKLNLLTMLLGESAKKVKKENILLYEKARLFIEEYFYFINVNDFKTATLVTKGLIKKGIDVHTLILDPANAFRNGFLDTGNNYTDGEVAGMELQNFSKNVCSVHLSQHPNMFAQRSSEDVVSSNGEGGWFFNKASLTYCVNRDENSNRNRITVDNVRNKHTGGGVTSSNAPIIISWWPNRIDLELDGVIHENVIQFLRKKYNPLNEIFNSEVEKKDSKDDNVPF